MAQHPLVAAGHPARPGLSAAAGRRRLPACQDGGRHGTEQPVRLMVWAAAKDNRLVGRQKPDIVGGRARPGRPIARRRGIVRPQGAEPAPRKTALWPRCLVDP